MRTARQLSIPVSMDGSTVLALLALTQSLVVTLLSPHFLTKAFCDPPLFCSLPLESDGQDDPMDSSCIALQPGAEKIMGALSGSEVCKKHEQLAVQCCFYR